MYINNIIRNAFSIIDNISNKSNLFETKLNGFILGCYNTIVSFIKPINSKMTTFNNLSRRISLVENRELTHNYKNNKNISGLQEKRAESNAQLALAKALAKSDDIKEEIIKSILEPLKNINQNDIDFFRATLFDNTKNIFIGSYESNEEFSNKVINTIESSNDKLKESFGNLISFKYFLDNELKDKQ